MTEIQKAYIAGIIDGEGYIGLTKDNNSNRYRPRVVIANSNLNLLKHIQNIIGGCIHKKKMTNRRYSNYNLCIRYFNKWLPDILPFLVGKKRKAELLLEALELLAVRKNRTAAAQDFGLKRLSEIDYILRKKEWLI